MADIFPFTDVPYPLVTDPNYPGGQQSFSNLTNFKAGRGTKSMGMDSQGLWLGAEKFVDAPFRVSMEGVITITAGSGLNLDAIADGTTYKRTTSNEKTGAGRGYNAINSSNRYSQWLSAGELASGTNPATGVVFDANGIRGYKASVKNFEITSGGDALFRGDILASNITGSSINTYVNETDLVACHMSPSSAYGFYVDQNGTSKMISMTAFDDGTGYRGIIQFYDGGSYTGRIGGLTGWGVYFETNVLMPSGYDLIVGDTKHIEILGSGQIDFYSSGGSNVGNIYGGSTGIRCSTSLHVASGSAFRFDDSYSSNLSSSSGHPYWGGNGSGNIPVQTGYVTTTDRYVSQTNGGATDYNCGGIQLNIAGTENISTLVLTKY